MADEAVIGSVAVDVVPSADTFWRDFEAKTQSGARRAGDDLGDSISGPIADKVSRSVGDGLAKAAPSTKEQGSRQGASFADEFDKQVETRIEAALKNLPDVNVDADMTAADAKLAELRTTLVGLSQGNYLKVGLTDADAIATLDKLRAELDELARQTPDIRVKVDAAAASLELAALQAQIDKINRGPGGPGGRGPGGGGAFGGLSSSAAGAGTSITELLLPAIALIGPTIVPAVASGVAGLGVLALGAKGLADNVTGALTPAFHDLEKQATSALAPFSVEAIGDIEGALGKLEPLVNSVGAVVGKDIDGATAWLNGSGIKEITSYIDEVMPPTNRLLIEATQAVGEFLGSTRDQGTQTIGVLGNVLDIFNDIQRVSSELPKVSGNASGGQGVLQGIEKLATGNEQGGLTQLASIGTGYLSQGADKLPGLASDFGHLFVNKQQPKAPLPAAPGLSSEALQQATGGLDTSSQVIEATAKSYGVLVAAYQAASTSAAQNKAAEAATTLQMQLENNAVGLLSQALQGLGGDNLGVAQANTAFETGLLTLKGTLKGNHDALTGNTSAALANQAALQQQVAAAQAVYQAIAQQTDSTVQAKAAYDKAIASIEASTGATGQQKAAIDGYIESIGKIPPVKSTQIDIDDAAALATLADLQNQLKHLPGVTITSQAVLRSDAAGYAPHAAGGMVGDGFFSTGEQGIEYGYKRGSSVQIFNHQQSMAMANQGPQVIQNHITLTLDGKVVAQSVNEYNLAAVRR